MLTLIFLAVALLHHQNTHHVLHHSVLAGIADIEVEVDVEPTPETPPKKKRKVTGAKQKGKAGKAGTAKKTKGKTGTAKKTTKVTEAPSTSKESHVNVNNDELMIVNKEDGDNDDLTHGKTLHQEKIVCADKNDTPNTACNDETVKTDVKTVHNERKTVKCKVNDNVKLLIKNEKYNDDDVPIDDCCVVKLMSSIIPASNPAPTRPAPAVPPPPPTPTTSCYFQPTPQTYTPTARKMTLPKRPTSGSKLKLRRTHCTALSTMSTHVTQAPTYTINTTHTNIPPMQQVNQTSAYITTPNISSMPHAPYVPPYISNIQPTSTHHVNIPAPNILPYNPSYIQTSLPPIESYCTKDTNIQEALDFSTPLNRPLTPLSQTPLDSQTQTSLDINDEDAAAVEALLNTQ